MEDEDPQASLIHVLHAIRLVTSCEAASCTLFIWDYILTFSMEVDLVWKSKWNFIKGLYLFQRYLPFIDTLWRVLHVQTGGSLTKSACRNLYYSTGVMMAVGIAASEMILTIRTWAVWNRNKYLSIILPTLYVLVWGSCVIIVCIFLNSITFSDPPYTGLKGCFLTQANKDLVIVWVQLIAWDTLVLVLMLVPGVQAYQYGGNTSLIKVIYRDGVIYYLYLFILSLINIVLIETFPVS